MTYPVSRCRVSSQPPQRAMQKAMAASLSSRRLCSKAGSAWRRTTFPGSSSATSFFSVFPIRQGIFDNPFSHQRRSRKCQIHYPVDTHTHVTFWFKRQNAEAFNPGAPCLIPERLRELSKRGGSFPLVHVRRPSPISGQGVGGFSSFDVFKTGDFRRVAKLNEDHRAVHRVPQSLPCGASK